MARRKTRRPTDSELTILRVLWNRGEATVRDVHGDLARRGGPGYTTILKLLQIMHEKGLVERDDSRRAHVYRAAADSRRTQTQLVTDLVDRAFGGSAATLVVRALSARKASSGELQEIRHLLDELEGKEPKR